MEEVESGGHILAAYLMDTQTPRVISLKQYWQRINLVLQSSFSKGNCSNLDNMKLCNGKKFGGGEKGKDVFLAFLFKEMVVTNFTWLSI